MPRDSRTKLNQVLEAYKPMPMRRMFYPRGFKLSENFINAFHEEYDRLVGEGINPKTLVERFGKALRFHVTEKRRYGNSVVEAAGSAKAAVDSANARKKHKMDKKPSRSGKKKAIDPMTGHEVGSPAWVKEKEAAALSAPHGQDQSY